MLLKYIKHILSVSLVAIALSGFSQTATVSGIVLTQFGTPLEEVMVFTDDNQYSTMTDAQGSFSLELPTGASYTLAFEDESNYKEGVSFRDMITIRKIILGLIEFPAEGDWELIAGDLNNNGGVSTLDAVLLQKLLVSDEEPELVNSWFFFDGENTNSTITDLTSDISDLDIRAIKRGNLDCN